MDRKPFENGYVLAFTILLILGVTSIAIGTMYRAKMNRVTSINYKEKIRTFNAADGLMTLLAQEAINGRILKYVDSTTYGRIRGEVWTGVPGLTVKSLKDWIASAPSPNYVDSSYYLGSNWDLDDYGVRWTGWLLPPVSGPYIFSVLANDAGSFYLSSNDTSTGLPLSPTCSVATVTNSWPTTGSGVSQPIQLLAGNRYYFEFYHKQGGGTDIGMVGWTGPEWISGKPIGKFNISRFRNVSAYAFTDTVGTVPVRYRVAGVGLDRYGLFTEGILERPGSTGDTAFRSPLTQILSVKGSAIRPPDTAWMRVIYYDYEYCKVNNNTWNPVNPEFEVGIAPPLGAANDMESRQVETGMVQRKQFTWTDTNASYFGFSTIPKPVLGNTPFLNCGVKHWFRPWSPGNFKAPKYRNSAPDTRRTCTDDGTPNSNWYTAAHDTSYKNKVFRDSLPFERDAVTGAYVFDSTDFYPLDNRAGAYTTGGSYRNTGALHNYNFCAELHTKFEHFAGATFEFYGDDDVWVFVNDSLVIDLGAVHGPNLGSVSLDDITNMKYGETYRMDLFFCERHSPGSRVRMVTNLPMARLQGTPVVSWKRDYGMMD